MEVHHHPDLNHTPKHWKEYFLEFLMIFLAVTMGFFAESIRESISDRSKENEYIVSIIEDMKKDSAALTHYIYTDIPYHRKWIATEINLLQQPSFAGKSKEIFQALILGNLWTYDFFKTERTLSQLNAEGFRLIKNREIVGAITDWQTQLEYNNITLTKTMDLQSDIDVSANIFADADIINSSCSIALGKLTKEGLVSLDLSDVPDSVQVQKPDDAELKSYIKTLKVHNYYLISNLQTEYKYDLKVLDKTLLTLESNEK